MDTVQVKKDTSSSQHIRSLLSLNKLLQKASPTKLNYTFKYYPDENHGSIPLITIYDALRFSFKFYDMKMYREDWVNFSMETIRRFEKHYQDVSNHFGFRYEVPEALFNRLGYEALSQKKMAEAEYLFKRNISSYPASSNVYDSMADFYYFNNEKAKAIEFLRKALAIKEHAPSRAKLNQLEKSN